MTGKPKSKSVLSANFLWAEKKKKSDFGMMFLLLLYISGKGKTNHFEISEGKWFNVINFCPQIKIMVGAS